MLNNLFIDFNSVMVATIGPGNNTGDPWVVGIQCLRYLPNGFIIYKLEHGDYA